MMSEKPSEKSCLSLVNDLINQWLSNVPEIKNISEIDSNLIITLCESVTGRIVPDLLVVNDTVEEAHNVQAVIDMLSLDILNISLSHITGEAVMAGNIYAIFNLFQVLKEVSSFISAKNNTQSQRTSTNLKEKINVPTTNGHDNLFPLHQNYENINQMQDLNKDVVDEGISLEVQAPSHHSRFSKSHRFTQIHQTEDSENKADHPLKRTLKRKICKLQPSKSRRSKDNLINGESIEKMYKDNLKLEVTALIDRNSDLEERSLQLKKRYLQTMTKTYKKPSFPPPCRKGYLLPYNLKRRQAIKSASSKNKVTKQKLSEDKKTKTKTEIIPVETSNFIQTILSELPGMDISPRILRHITDKYEQHLFKLYSQVKKCLLQKPLTEKLAEAAAKKLHTKSEILKKDLQEKQYLRDMKEQRYNENKIRYKLRDSRLKSVQMKQYYNEFQVEMRKKMMKPNTAEEHIFENVFKEVINIQRDHVEHLCRQVKEENENDARNYINYLASLENLYQSQLALLSEQISNEKKETQIRFRSEKQEFEKMQMEFKKLLKSEIRVMQKTTLEIVQDTHFRKLDAEQFVERMREQYT